MDEDPIVAYSLLTCGIIILICVILGLVRLCCKSGTSGMTRVGYPVAISNRLFNESFSFFVLASEVFDRESIVLLYFLSLTTYFNCLKCDHLKKLLAVKKLCKNNNGLKMSAINCFSCFALRT